MTGWEMNWKGFESKWSWPNLGTILSFPLRGWKNSNTCWAYSTRIWPKYSAETFKTKKTVTPISISDLTVIGAFTSNEELRIKVQVYSDSCFSLCPVSHIVRQAVVHAIHTRHWHVFCSVWQILESKRKHLYDVWKVMGILFSLWSSRKHLP